MSIEKYHGIIPALYAAYDEQGEVSSERIKQLTQYMIDSGVKGLYVGGSSGECIYQSVEDRKVTLESVMSVAKGKITIIAHVACNNTKDSCELAKHAQDLGVDAIAAIPPIYFKLPGYAIVEYWNDIAKAASETDFIIYNIPQLAGVSLTTGMLQEMLKNPKVVGVKNSSMPVMDIQQFKAVVGPDKVIFNGPDEQLLSGLVAGAEGGIGGTYGAMPELYIKLYELYKAGELAKAQALQNELCEIIYKMVSLKGNMYGVIKAIIKGRTGIDCGSVRKPLTALTEDDAHGVEVCRVMIDEAVKKYL